MRRKDFDSAEGYGRALWASGPSPYEIELLRRLPGYAGAIARAVFGESQADLDAELDAAYDAKIRRERFHTFHDKLPRRVRHARRAADRDGRPPTFLTARQVGEILSALEYALARGFVLDTSVTLDFALLSATEERVWAIWTRFKKCLRVWLSARACPQAWIGVWENGHRIGLHLHLMLHIPVGLRTAFRAWCRGWVTKQLAQLPVDARATRTPVAISRHTKSMPDLHWRLACYAMKGHDGQEVVQAGCDAPDGRDVLLSDLLPFASENTGAVPFERLEVGQSLCVAERRKGSRQLQPTLPASDAPWQSAWERGFRDVNVLFPKSFVEFVRNKKYRVDVPLTDDVAGLRELAGRVRAHGRLLADQQVDPASHEDYAIELASREAYMVGIAIDRMLGAIDVHLSLQSPTRSRITLNAVANAMTRALAELDLCASVAERRLDEGVLQASLWRASLALYANCQQLIAASLVRLGENTPTPGWVVRLQLAVLDGLSGR